MAKLGDTMMGARVLAARVAAWQRRANPGGRMPLMEHLRELRNRLLKAITAVLAATAVGLIPQVYDHLWRFIEHPFLQAEHSDHAKLIVIGVFDPFMIRVQVAFYFGLIITCPVWLYQLWAFIAPGLYRRERRWAYFFVGAALPLFAVGATIAYFAMTKGIRFLLGVNPHGVVAIITINTYLSYAFAMLAIFGLAFELPLVFVLLNLAGVLTHERFRKSRRMIIFLVFAFAAICTPSPDPISMLLLAVPCVLLVEASEVFAWVHDRRRARHGSLQFPGLTDEQVAEYGLDQPIDDQ